MPSRVHASRSATVLLLTLFLAGCAWQRTPMAPPTAAPPRTPISTPTVTRFDAGPTASSTRHAQPSATPAPTPSSTQPTLAPSSQRAYSATLHLMHRDGTPFSTEAAYLLYLPRGYGQERGRKWPLVLFLHGSEERGDDAEQVRRNGLPKVLDQGAELPALVLSPQCPARTRWWQSTPFLGALLDLVESSYAVDSSRVYVTGWSMGAYGTWALALDYPRRFAALAPIAGGGDFRDDSIPENLCQLRDVPVWVFHGARDETIAPSESENAVQALQACGGNVRFTLYPEAGHDGAWELAYTDAVFYQWMLQQARR